MKRIVVLLVVVFVSGVASQAWSERAAQNSDCVASASAPTYTEGQSVPCSDDLNGNLRITQGTTLAGENIPLDQIYTSESGLAVRYITTGNKNVSATPGEIVGFFAASGTTLTVTPYDDPDGTCSSNQTIGPITLTNGVFTKFPVRYTFGICLVVAGTAPDLVVIYRNQP